MTICTDEKKKKELWKAEIITRESDGRKSVMAGEQFSHLLKLNISTYFFNTFLQ